MRVREGEKVNTCDVSQFDSRDNLVMNVHVLASVYNEIAMCRQCQLGELQLLNSGTKGNWGLNFVEKVQILQFAV